MPVLLEDVKTLYSTHLAWAANIVLPSAWGVCWTQCNRSTSMFSLERLDATGILPVKLLGMPEAEERKSAHGKRYQQQSALCHQIWCPGMVLLTLLLPLLQQLI